MRATVARSSSINSILNTIFHSMKPMNLGCKFNSPPFHRPEISASTFRYFSALLESSSPSTRYLEPTCFPCRHTLTLPLSFSRFFSSLSDSPHMPSNDRLQGCHNVTFTSPHSPDT